MKKAPKRIRYRGATYERVRDQNDDFVIINGKLLIVDGTNLVTAGGQTFIDIAAGRDMADAFDSAVKHALYEYGHRGYTGTIAEKPGFQDVGNPSPTTNYVTLVRHAEDMLFGDADRVPEELRGWVREAAKIYDDKWGPAAAFEIKGAQTEDMKDRPEQRVFVFFGFASI